MTAHSGETPPKADPVDGCVGVIAFPFGVAWLGFVLSRVYIWLVALPLGLPLLGWMPTSGLLIIWGFLKFKRKPSRDDDKTCIEDAAFRFLFGALVLGTAWTIRWLGGVL